MTSKRIVYTTFECGISIIIPALKAREQVIVTPEKRNKNGPLNRAAVYRNETDDEFLTRIAKKDVPAGRSWHMVDASDLPADRNFREAWKQEGDAVKVCMNTARDIHMNRIRAARNERLQAMDIEIMKGNDVQKQKQVLRDLPKTVDLNKAKTPDELKSIWPDELS